MCLNYKSETGCACGKECRFRHVEAVEKPSKKWNQGHLAPQKIREREGPSLGVIQKCESHERNPCASRFEERTQGDTVHKERCAHKAAWDLAENVQKLTNTHKASFYTPVLARAMLTPTLVNIQEEQKFVVDSRASMHMLSKKDLSSDEMDTLRRSRNPYDGRDRKW